MAEIKAGVTMPGGSIAHVVRAVAKRDNNPSDSLHIWVTFLNELTEKHKRLAGSSNLPKFCRTVPTILVLPMSTFFTLVNTQKIEAGTLEWSIESTMPIVDLGLLEGLPILVERRYKAAEAKKDIAFSTTQLAILHIGKIPVRTEFCGLTDYFSFSNSSN